jgi:leucine dehydrogenase
VTLAWHLPDFDAHEDVHFFYDAGTGLRAIIAIHSTHLGPAAGGARFWSYAEDDTALTDALRLSRGMSYKNAMAGLPMGGGKAVILKDAEGKSDARMEAFGRMIDSLGGRYVTAEDVGMTDADMRVISRTTRHVSGLPVAAGAAGGNPGPSTALGVFLGLKAAVRHKLGRLDVNGLHVAIQGVGSVGGGLARHLAAEGARLTLADADMSKARSLADELGGTAVPASEIMRVPADVFSPCALGAVLAEESIAALDVAVIAGGANNQLATPGDGELVHQRGILYAPDYVINAGGIINVSAEYLGLGDAEAVRRRVAQIPERLTAIFEESDREGLPTDQIADRMAQRLIGRG